MISGYSGCAACPLKDCKPLEGRGSAGGLMIIGEAPNTEEVVKKTPFLGSAGAILRRSFQEVCDFPFSEAYLTNAVLCKPHDGKIPSGAAEACRQRLLDEIRTVQPRKILLTGATATKSVLGAKSIIKARGLGALYQYEGGEAYVIPTYHPAAILRQDDLFRDFVGDIYKLCINDRPREWEWTLSIVSSIEELVDYLTLFRSASAVSCDIETTGFDQFKDRILSVGFGVSFDDNKALSVVIPRELILQCKDLIYDFFRTYPGYIVFHNGKFDLQFFKTWYEDIDFEPLKFMDTMMMQYALDERGISGSGDAGGRGPSTAGLKDIGRLRFDIPDYHFNFKEFYAIPEDDRDWWKFYEYHGLDCALTIATFFELQTELLNESPRLWDLVTDLLIPGTLAFAKMEYHGVPLDRGYLENLRTEWTSKADELLDQLKRIAREKYDFELTNPASTPQIHKMYRLMKFEPPTTDKDAMQIELNRYALSTPSRTILNTMIKAIEGDPKALKEMDSIGMQRGWWKSLALEFKVTFNPEDPDFIAETLSKLGVCPETLGVLIPDNQLSPDLIPLLKEEINRFHYDETVRTFIQTLMDWRQYSRLTRNYMTGFLMLMDESNRVHPDVWINGTDTGRLSIHSPAIQTIPIMVGSVIRKAFNAPEGWSFINADYSQMELRVAAYFSRDENMIKAYRDGLDLHRWVASLMFQKPMDQISKMERYVAKYMDFGVLYGRDLAGGLSYGPEAEQIYKSMGRYLTNDECAKLQADFFNSFPGLKSWIDSTHAEAISQQYIETPLGRRRRFPFIHSGNRGAVQRRAVNTKCQSTASDFTLNAIINMTRRLPKDKCVITFTVHDSIAFICKDEYIDEACTIIREEMEKPPFPEFDVPVKADIGVAKTWGALGD